MADDTHVIIIGGGFGGLACGLRLAGESGIQVTLLDRRGFHQFTPLLYQVATAELAGKDVSFDLAHRFRRHRNVRVRVAEAVAIDPHRRRVTLGSGEYLDADVLVLAAGAQPNFFHTPGAQEHSYPLYSLLDAERVRGQLLRLLRNKTVSAPPAIVVVGGGPTGVETAGALSDLIDDVAPHITQWRPDPAEVILADHGKVLLAPFSPDSQRRAIDRLRERGVRVRTGVAVTEVGPDHVRLGDGTRIDTRLAIWAGGERAGRVVADSGLPTGHGGRIEVAPDLSVDGFPGVYAVGDAANIPDGAGGALPQLGSVAKQAGSYVGHAIIAARKGRAQDPFHYHDQGIMAMIDRQVAVAEIGSKRREVHGRMAFATWLAVHEELLRNTRAELDVLSRWADEFYLRPHHRAESLLDPGTADRPRLRQLARTGTGDTDGGTR